MMRSVELFVGAGGLGIGVSQAGFRPAAVMDWDRWACDTLRENKERCLDPIAHWPIHEGDVRQFDFGTVDGSVDLVTGGPPCQPFSMGGRHRAFLDGRDMFPQAIRAVRELRPRAFIFENVKGLTRSSFANYLEYIRLQLTYPDLVCKRDEEWLAHLARLEDHHTKGTEKGLRYRVVMRVLNSANYGVPQDRVALPEADTLARRAALVAVARRGLLGLAPRRSQEPAGRWRSQGAGPEDRGTTSGRAVADRARRDFRSSGSRTRTGHGARLS